MYKFITGAIVAALISLFTPSAFADPLYAHVTVGQSTNTSVDGINLSDGFAYSGDIGAKVGPVRLEVGAAHVSMQALGVLDIDAVDYRATAFLDLPVSARSSLFAGAGVDYVKASASYGPYSADVDGNGWHVTGGLAHRVSDRVTLEASVNHVEADLGFTAKTDIFSLGARFAL